MSEKNPVLVHYEFISDQIDREDKLINYRLTWTLQLSGFLFAAFALASKESFSEYRDFFSLYIPILGALIGVAGLLGVLAANLQMNYLAKKWKQLPANDLPRPFGDKRSYKLGTVPQYVFLVGLVVVWGIAIANRPIKTAQDAVTVLSGDVAGRVVVCRAPKLQTANDAGTTCRSIPVQ